MSREVNSVTNVAQQQVIKLTLDLCGGSVIKSDVNIRAATSDWDYAYPPASAFSVPKTILGEAYIIVNIAFDALSLFLKKLSYDSVSWELRKGE